MTALTQLIAPLSTIAAVVAILAASYWLMLGRHPDLGNERRFPRQLVMLGLSIIGLLAIVFSLPVDGSARDQLISLVGLVVSGMVAFASTTIVSNLMAGILLRMTRPFRTGDFIQVAEHFGRVTERGLFDTEVQTEARELIALPNTLLVSRPVKTIRSSGTLVSATVSLGYDVHRTRIAPALCRAAQRCGLRDPFVHVIELGNHAASYRVSGLLADVKTLLTCRSALHEQVLDCLHEEGIEIVSPTFMNQRRIDAGTAVIPAGADRTDARHAVRAEAIAFDKAEAAERNERAEADLSAAIAAHEAALAYATEDAERARHAAAIEASREALLALRQGHGEASR